jgi:hypothetical protein
LSNCTVAAVDHKASRCKRVVGGGVYIVEEGGTNSGRTFGPQAVHGQRTDVEVKESTTTKSEFGASYCAHNGSGCGRRDLDNH